MSIYTGDDLINLFEKLNIETGTINAHVIRGWFDTDCEDLLNWFCSNITEENCVTAQEYLEYKYLEKPLTKEELEKEIKLIELEHPDLFKYDENVFEVELAKSEIEMLEEQIQDYDKQLKFNDVLYQNLCSEISKLSSEEMKSQLEKEAAEQACLKLGIELDEFNSKSFQQVVKYHNFLRNFEFAELPEFINNTDIAKFEDKFNDIIACIKTDNEIADLLDNSLAKSVGHELLQVQNRLFHSNVSSIILEMQVESLNNVLKFIESYDVIALTSSIHNSESLQLEVKFNKSEQNRMLKMMEESTHNFVAQYVSKPKLNHSKNELNFYKSRLSYLNKVKESLGKILSHFVVMYNLYLQEKIDISSSSKFFKNIIKYINKDLQDTVYRKECMMKVINKYEEFSSSPIENQFKLIRSLGLFLTNNPELSLSTVLEETNKIENKIEKLEKQHFDGVRTSKIEKDLLNNIKNLENFLVSGPTCRIVSIPNTLQLTLFDTDLNVESQNSCVKLTMQIKQKLKERLSKNTRLNQRRQLWMHFVTDPAKMLAIIQQMK